MLDTNSAFFFCIRIDIWNTSSALIALLLLLLQFTKYMDLNPNWEIWLDLDPHEMNADQNTACIIIQCNAAVYYYHLEQHCSLSILFKTGLQLITFIPNNIAAFYYHLNNTAACY